MGCTEPQCLYKGALYPYLLSLLCKMYSDYVADKTLVFKNLNVISTVKPTRCTNVSNLFYFGNDTLHVSDGLSIHHQQFKTVHTATGIRQTDTANCLLAGMRWNWFSCVVISKIK